MVSHTASAPEVVGASPLDAQQDFVISDILAPNPQSELCVARALPVEEDCVRIGPYQRWHSDYALCRIGATQVATGIPRTSLLSN